MLKFNRKTEYALIALRYLAVSKKQGDQSASAREISQRYQIPNPVMSKVLQELNNKKLIQSAQGSSGGYQLKEPLDKISLAQVVEIFEGPISLTNCLGGSSEICFMNDVCQVKTLFGTLNRRIADMLEETTLDAAPLPDGLPEKEPHRTKKILPVE